MNSVNVCVGVFCSSHTETDFTEKIYSSVYKNLVTFLYANPAASCTFYFSGTQLEWLEKNHTEFLQILRELSARKQIELLGGGYYNPIFPLLLPVDRVGQTELLTNAIRKSVDKRPRGVWLTGSVWDQSLIQTFNTCGMSYVMLDSQFLGSEGAPLFIEDMGKTLIVLPYNGNIAENSTETPKTYYDFIKKNTKSSSCVYESCFFDAEKLCNNIQEDFFSEFYSFLLDDTKFNLTLPSVYLKTNQALKKVYLSSGASPSILRHFSQNRSVHKNSVRNFLTDFPEAMQLYAKMIRTSILINQHRGDRVRKAVAREELWKAQNASSFWVLDTDGVTNKKVRENAYMHLINAVSLIRKSQNFSPSVTQFDYNLNGYDEYCFKFASYNFIVSPVAGCIYDFDSFVSLRNYTNTVQRSKEYDIASDSYPKKMFVDHFLSKDALLQVQAGTYRSSGKLLAQERYTELSFDRVKKELSFQIEGIYNKQAYLLTKKYKATASGIKVQYIIKNLSSSQINACFAVENNFAFFSAADDNLKLDAVVFSSLKKLEVNKLNLIDEGLSYIELKDLKDSITFILSVNEESGLLIAPLTITRPIEKKLTESYQATSCFLYWNLLIQPGCEIEKTITLTVPSTKGRRKERKITKG